MAYLIGIVGPDDRVLLRAAGLTLEPVSEELFAELDPVSYGSVGDYDVWQEELDTWVKIYLDASVPEIMASLDREKGEPDGSRDERTAAPAGSE
jgi:hypothetical protein